MADVSSFKDLIGMWPTIGAFASDLGVVTSTAAAWKHRGSIPTEKWPDLLRAAKGVGVELTLDRLLEIKPPRKAKAPKKRKRVKQ